jgi:aminoglycoside phosphotransferase (APT) family kinase protein
MFNPLTTPPTKEARAWAAAAFAQGARVTATKRLTGGAATTMHLLVIEDVHGALHHAVLRRWTDEDDVSAGAECVQREAHVLTQLATTELPAPRLLAIDPAGTYCGHAALLMTRLPGRIDLQPKKPDEWLRALATMLAEIHRTPVQAPPAQSWLEVNGLIVPDWTSRPELWRDAFALIGESPSADDECFIHHDYQPFNVLWRRGALTGVVDWVWGSTGSPSFDVGHCRLNLAILYSHEHAKRFLELYETISGRTVNAWRDVNELVQYLPGWRDFLGGQVGTRMVIDFEGIHDRVERTLADALRRV